MPVIACPDCGHDVSTLAPVCPHCGRPSPAGTTPMPASMPTPA
ncbi:MAG: zinc ribbon domain-containing protein, partial [Thermoanaerobaculia bacterium]